MRVINKINKRSEVRKGKVVEARRGTLEKSLPRMRGRKRR